MRVLDDEEETMLRSLNSTISTPDLIFLVRELETVLSEKGYVIQARVAALAAERLAAPATAG